MTDERGVVYYSKSYYLLYAVGCFATKIQQYCLPLNGLLTLRPADVALSLRFPRTFLIRAREDCCAAPVLEPRARQRACWRLRAMTTLNSRLLWRTRAYGTLRRPQALEIVHGTRRASSVGCFSAHDRRSNRSLVSRTQAWRGVLGDCWNGEAARRFASAVVSCCAGAHHISSVYVADHLSRSKVLSLLLHADLRQRSCTLNHDSLRKLLLPKS